MKTLKIILSLFAVVGLIIGGMYFASKIQPDPDDLFRRNLIGRWHNIPERVKTYIELNKDGTCNYHDKGRDNKCIYQVKGRVLIISLRMTEDVTAVFKKMDSSQSFDIREVTSLGMIIHQIHISKGVMSAKLKAISGKRQTGSKSIKLKKVR